MKYYIKPLGFLLTLIFFMSASANLDAQNYGKKRKKKKSPKTEKTKKEKTSSKTDKVDEWAFKDRLWYGAGFNMPTFGNSNGFSAFQIGLHPMVGYKIVEQWSVGPRVGFNYSYFKGTGSDNRPAVVQPVDWEFGIFSRYRIIPIIFAHAEFSFSSDQNVYDDGFGRIAVDADGEVITDKVNNQNFYLGLGYHSDAEIGYEVSVLYNVLQSPDSPELPFSIRLGFNYRF